MTSVTYIIDVPPSANRIWRVSKGKPHRSREYLSWIESALWDIHRQGKMTFGSAPVSLAITLPKSMRGDVDNRMKPIGDLLQRGKIIDNDRQVQDVRCMRGEDEECRVTIGVLS